MLSKSVSHLGSGDRASRRADRIQQNFSFTTWGSSTRKLLKPIVSPLKATIQWQGSPFRGSALPTIHQLRSQSADDHTLCGLSKARRTNWY